MLYKFLYDSVKSVAYYSRLKCLFSTQLNKCADWNELRHIFSKNTSNIINKLLLNAEKPVRFIQ